MSRGVQVDRCGVEGRAVAGRCDGVVESRSSLFESLLRSPRPALFCILPSRRTADAPAGEEGMNEWMRKV